jgi:hypothetical protein
MSFLQLVALIVYGEARLGATHIISRYIDVQQLLLSPEEERDEGIRCCIFPARFRCRGKRQYGSDSHLDEVRVVQIKTDGAFGLRRLYLLFRGALGHLDGNDHVLEDAAVDC